jgi:hypothetical protein
MFHEVVSHEQLTGHLPERLRATLRVLGVLVNLARSGRLLVRHRYEKRYTFRYKTPTSGGDALRRTQILRIEINALGEHGLWGFCPPRLHQFPTLKSDHTKRHPAVPLRAFKVPPPTLSDRGHSRPRGWSACPAVGPCPVGRRRRRRCCGRRRSYRWRRVFRSRS